MTRLLPAIALAAALSLPAQPVHADPTPSPVDPATAVTFPVVPLEFQVVPFEAVTLAIGFPQASTDGSVIEDGSVITLKTDVFFAYNSARLNARAAVVLDRAADKLTALDAASVRVSGYTDSRGSAAYNRALAKRRADAVLAALTERRPGLSGTVRAYGERYPVATNKTARGRALNRRVTITVTG